MYKISAKILVFLVLLSCGRSEENSDSLSDLPKYQDPDSRVTVRLGIDALGVRDESFNAMAWRGMTRFYGDTPEFPSKRGQFYDYFINKGRSEHIPNLETVLEGGYDLIIVTGYEWLDALSQVAPRFPQQKFVIIDAVGLPNQAKNIMEVVFAEEQGAFLVGLAAALKAKKFGLSPKFGFIGGVFGPVINRFQVGYMQGVRTIFPDAQIVSYYADSWDAPEKAGAQAKIWYDQGVYAIFSAAGFTGNGTLDEAKRRRLRGEDVWAIGVDSDQYGQGIYSEGKSATLTSMVKRLDAAVQLALWRVGAGKFEAEALRLDLRAGGVGLPEENPNLSSAILGEIRVHKKKVLEGEIIVDQTIAEFTASGHLGEGLESFE